MYIIIKKFNGLYDCQGQLQDGREFWQKNTLEGAIESMIEFAKIMNGVKIKKKDIKFLQEVHVQCVGLDKMEV